ncbi:MAG: HEAT repeat domain-containing protein [Methanolinea sp.]|jgi:HEAT repeat protein|nr:HEAT repeat domain-containing protein [Methanolinea sp.]
MAFSDLHLNRVDRYKLGILLLLVAVSVGLEVVVHHMMGIEVVYSHFFYIPVVLGAIWYGKRAVLVGVFLAVVYAGDYYLISGIVQTDAMIRALMFVVVALIIGVVMDYMHREQEQVMTQIANAALSGSTAGGFRGNLDEWRARLRTSVNVKRMKEERNTQGLILALRHRDAGIQYEAAEALGVLKEPSAVPPLMTALTGDRYSGVRWKAAEALAQIGEPSVGPLIQALGHPDEDVRWKAAIALGEIGDFRAISPLISLLEDQDRFVQSRAAYALGQFGSLGLPPLIVALESGGPDVRRGAALALGKIGDPGAIDPLLVALDDREDSVRSAALEALPSLGDEAFPRILAHLRLSSPAVRALTLQSLREMTDRKVLERFRPHLAEADEETKEAILSQLGTKGERSG